MKLFERRAVLAATVIAALLAIVSATAASALVSTSLHPGHTAAVMGKTTKKTYEVKVKFGKAKVPTAVGRKASQGAGCEPPLISFSRTDLCFVVPAEVEVILQEDGKPAAEETYTFGIQADTRLSATSTNLNLEATVIPGTATGDLPEPVPSVTISATCDPCHVGEPLLVIGSPSGGSGVGVYNVITYPSQTVWPELLVGMYADAGGAESDTVSAPVPGIRCDNAYPKTWKPGCVFPAYIPTVDMSSLPVIARNIRAVQGRGIHVGRPGGVHPLHRGSSAQQAENNRKLVCPKHLKRPKGDQCDEYPFASTAEGGTALPPVDRYVGWVPQQENLAQGVILSAFYRNDRVLPGDAFYVNA